MLPNIPVRAVDCKDGVSEAQLYGTGVFSLTRLLDLDHEGATIQNRNEE